MMAIGVCLVLLGYFMMRLMPSEGLTWRDIFGLFPVVAGVVLCFASGVVWLWRVMP